MSCVCYILTYVLYWPHSYTVGNAYDLLFGWLFVRFVCLFACFICCFAMSYWYCYKYHCYWLFFSHCYLFSWFFNCKCDMAVTDIIVALWVLSWFYAHLTFIVFTAVVSGVFMLVRSIGTWIVIAVSSVACVLLIAILNVIAGDVAQWVARLTRDRWIPVSREFEPQQRPLLFPWARNFTLIA